MTYWMTLWYAGSVVMTLGYEGQTLKECETLGRVVMQDIALAYVEKPEEMAETMFPDHRFKVSCEPEQLPIDEVPF
jgi:hypothetical protein